MSPFPQPFPVEDNEWRRLSAIGGLPDSARADVEIILQWGRFFADLDTMFKPAHAVKARLTDLHRKARALLDGCAQVLTDPPAPEGFCHPVLLMSAIEFVPCLDALAQLAAGLEHAARRIPKDRTGNKIDALDFVTEAVDDLLRQHTGRSLTPGQYDGRREFLGACLELIGLKAKLDWAIRKVAAKRACEVSSEKK